MLIKEEPGLIQQITQGNIIWREGMKNLQEEYNITDEMLEWNKDTLKRLYTMKTGTNLRNT